MIQLSTPGANLLLVAQGEALTCLERVHLFRTWHLFLFQQLIVTFKTVVTIKVSYSQTFPCLVTTIIICSTSCSGKEGYYRFNLLV